tara:strand:- start:2375 stop:2599 length:225 start_codon:yes stop_codon:yes gene_type:complete
MKLKGKKHVSKRIITPLTGGFMITSIIGFLLSAFWIYDISKAWGFAFCFVFTLMFVASLISMTYAPVSKYSYFK